MAQCVLAEMPVFPTAGKFEDRQSAPTIFCTFGTALALTGSARADSLMNRALPPCRFRTLPALSV
jgi:hypothetical protein